MKSINPKPFLLGALSVVSRWHELKRRLLTQPWVFSLFRKPYQPLVRSVAFSLLSQAPPTTRESRRLVSDQRPNHCNVSIFVYKGFIVTNGGVMIPLVRRPGGGVTGFVVSYFTQPSWVFPLFRKPHQPLVRAAVWSPTNGQI